jgi:hypothetical protein
MKLTSMAFGFIGIGELFDIAMGNGFIYSFLVLAICCRMIYLEQTKH